MLSEKEKKFDITTQKLVKLAGGYKVIVSGEFTFPQIVEKLRNTFKDPYIYHKIFTRGNCNFAHGYCLAASYCVMQHTGGKDIWKLIKGQLHWWLIHKATGQIFDITYDQFNSYYNYANGTLETRIGKAPIFTKAAKTQASLLAKYAGIQCGDRR